MMKSPDKKLAQDNSPAMEGRDTLQEQSLPIGNGYIGANIWLDDAGIIHALISHNEALSEMGRLVKVGHLEIRLKADGLDPSRLHLDLDADEGMVFLRTGDDPSFLGRLWVDAHHPCVRFEAEAETPFTAEARLLLCRPHRRVVPNTHVRAWDFTESVGFLMAAPKPDLNGYPVEPDHLCDDGANTLVWYHRNPYSWLSWHGTGWENHRAHDRYVDRTFGGCITGNGWQRVAPDTLRMNAPARRTSLDTTIHCAQTGTLDEWRDDLRNLASGLPGAETTRGAHIAWWRGAAARSFIRISGSPEAQRVSEGYRLQSYLTTCANRSRYPIHFNGSIFNVAWTMVHPDGRRECYDADYRRWHASYWGQNTRLIYWPLLAAGDFEGMRAYFRFHLEILPAAMHRGGLALRDKSGPGKSGAFYWETMALHDNIEVRVVPEKGTGFHYFTSSLEMLMMGFDFLDFTGDRTFAVGTLLPLATAVLDFYHAFGDWPEPERYSLTAHATESYKDSVNPTPDIAGLAAVLPRAIEAFAQDVPEEVLSKWRSFLEALPPLPTRDARDRIPMLAKSEALYSGMGYDVEARVAAGGDPVPILAPAEKIQAEAWNIENPELYPVFPFRRLGIGHENLEMARNTFRYRRFQHNRGWAQDPIMAARLGFADEARRMVADRFNRTHPGARFAAFWEAGFDWIPDQDNGGVASIALQSMLIQWDGRLIHLLPAWPPDWDVEFRLHAPFQTIVEGKIEGGNLVSLRVTPETRLADVRLHGDWKPVNPSKQN